VNRRERRIGRIVGREGRRGEGRGTNVTLQIAEKALTIWSCENNECILRLVAENVEVVLPILFPSLYYVAKSHWHKAIR
jgi:hypothetical protein